MILTLNGQYYMQSSQPDRLKELILLLSKFAKYNEMTKEKDFFSLSLFALDIIYFTLFFYKCDLTHGRTRKFIPPPWEKGGWMKPLPGVFHILPYFETILQLVESM